MSIAITLTVGTVGGLLAYRRRWAGGTILWSILFTAATHIAFSSLQPLPPEFRIAAQIAIGTVVGSSLSRTPLASLRRFLRPVAGAILGMLIAAIGLGLLLGLVSDLDALTALFSTAPGGAGDMTAAALQYSDKAGVVAGFHLIRQLFIYIVLAALIRRIRPARAA